ncbi:hypothetical protein VM1G_11404 [Cytospora mali]|uniref:DUF7703 domain-containing protein n=1 Tax=Cytospora mali TaxID=578113 RepID=A0A194VRV5_CYTMA|nr:hypothetical protein VM1G_11404 [Valsa mali]
MGDIPDIKKDLPMSMTMSAFAGISCYVGVEINVSLFLRFKKRHGLYFWSCALCAWGVILQPLFIILADFDVWTNLKGSITMIYLTWLIMVVPQSWVLYSRLHLVTHKNTLLRWIMAVLLFNSIIFSIPTIIIGIYVQATDVNPYLHHVNTIWDRLQTTVFFVQETFLSITYIYQTRKFLRDTTLLQNSLYSPSPRTAADKRPLLYQLIYTNLLIIALDITLLGIQYANLFYLQGAFKPCVYGIKLKVEFVILNRLIKSVRSRSEHRAHGSGTLVSAGQSSVESGKRSWWSRLMKTTSQREQGEHVGLGNMNGRTAHRAPSQESQAPIVRSQGNEAGGDNGLVHWQR